MEEVKYNNKYYTISVDTEKNRMIIQPIGFWRSTQVVPNYIEEILMTFNRYLHKDFMIILDISKMLTHPKEVQEEIHSEASKMLMKKNPRAVVVVLPQDDISLMQAQFLGKQLGVQPKSFATFEEANDFLDAYCKKHGLPPFEK